MARFSILFSAFVLLLASCATAPVQEMSDARQSIEDAVAAGAEQHAPRALARARELLRQAELQLEEGAYKAARADAERAKEAAIEAREFALEARHDKTRE